MTTCSDMLYAKFDEEFAGVDVFLSDAGFFLPASVYINKRR